MSAKYPSLFSPSLGLLRHWVIYGDIRYVNKEFHLLEMVSSLAASAPVLKTTCFLYYRCIYRCIIVIFIVVVSLYLLLYLDIKHLLWPIGVRLLLYKPTFILLIYSSYMTVWLISFMNGVGLKNYQNVLNMMGTNRYHLYETLWRTFENF